jgi:hypothetical protein
MKYTDAIKPLSQLVSNIPQIIACVKLHTTTGLSMYGQHLHFAGALFGFMMLILQQNFSFVAWFLYANSFAQTYSIYTLAAWYGELRLSDGSKEDLAFEEVVVEDGAESLIIEEDLDAEPSEDSSPIDTTTNQTIGSPSH